MKNAKIKMENDNVKCKTLEDKRIFEFCSVIFHFDFYSLN